MFILTLVQLCHHLRQQGKIWRNEDQKIQQSQGSCTRWWSDKGLVCCGVYLSNGPWGFLWFICIICADCVMEWKRSLDEVIVNNRLPCRRKTTSWDNSQTHRMQFNITLKRMSKWEHLQAKLKSKITVVMHRQAALTKNICPLKEISEKHHNQLSAVGNTDRRKDW